MSIVKKSQKHVYLFFDFFLVHYYITPHSYQLMLGSIYSQSWRTSGGRPGHGMAVAWRWQGSPFQRICKIIDRANLGLAVLSKFATISALSQNDTLHIYIYIYIYIYTLESSGHASRGLDSFWFLTEPRQ